MLLPGHLLDLSTPFTTILIKQVIERENLLWIFKMCLSPTFAAWCAAVKETTVRTFSVPHS